MPDTTQWVGLVTLAIAALACFRARRLRPWRLLAVLHTLLWVELIAGFRHLLHDMVNTGLIANGLYQQRSGSQIALLIGLAAITLVMSVVVLRQSRAMARVGLLASGCLSLLFLVEVVSLHRIDALLYRPVGPIYMIAILWLILSLATAGAALLDKPARSRKMRRHGSGRGEKRR